MVIVTQEGRQVNVPQDVWDTIKDFASDGFASAPKSIKNLARGAGLTTAKAILGRPGFQQPAPQPEDEQLFSSVTDGEPFPFSKAPPEQLLPYTPIEEPFSKEQETWTIKDSTGVQTIKTEPGFIGRIQEEQASKFISEKDILRAEAGRQKIPVGSVVVQVGEGSYKETYKIGNKVYERTVKAPAGEAFVPFSQGEQTLFVGVDVDPTTAQAMMRAEQSGMAEQILAKAGALERGGLEARTLLSEKGFDLIGSYVIGNVDNAQKIIAQNINKDLTASRGGQNIVSDFGRGVIEGFQSPVVEVELAALGGVGLGVASGTVTGAKIIGSTAGKALLIGAGGASLAMRGYEVKAELDTGNAERAIGLGLVTLADVATAFKGFKLTAPEPVGARLEGLSKLELKVEKGASYKGSVKTELIHMREVELKLPQREFISIKDLPGLKDVGYSIKTQDIQLKVGTITKQKKPIIDWAFTIKKDVAGNIQPIKQIQYKEVPVKPATYYVARDVKTGQIYQFGKQKTFLRDIGLQKKFTKIGDKGLDVHGMKNVKIQTIIAEGEKDFAYLTKQAESVILKPVKTIKPSETSPGTSAVRPRPPSRPPIHFKEDVQMKSIVDAAAKLEKQIKKITPAVKSVTEPEIKTPSLGAITKLATPKLQMKEQQKAKGTTIQEVKQRRKGTAIQEPNVKMPRQSIFAGLKAALVSSLKLNVQEVNTVKTPSIQIPGMQVTPQKLTQSTQTTPRIPDLPEPTPSKTYTPAPPIKLPVVPINIFLSPASLKKKKFGTKFIKNPVPDLKDVLKGVKI